MVVRLNGLVSKYAPEMTRLYCEYAMELGEELRIEIDSEGGSAFAGKNTAMVLREFSAKGLRTVGVVVGSCRSAATAVLAGCTERKAMALADFCYHEPYFCADEEMKITRNTARSMAASLETAINIYADMYQTACNISREQILSLLEEDKYITAQEALAMGFITEIVEYKIETNAEPLIPADLEEDDGMEDTTAQADKSNFIHRMAAFASADAQKPVDMALKDYFTAKFGAKAEDTPQAPTTQPTTPADIATDVVAEMQALKAQLSEMKANNDTLRAELEDAMQTLAERLAPIVPNSAFVANAAANIGANAQKAQNTTKQLPIT